MPAVCDFSASFGQGFVSPQHGIDIIHDHFRFLLGLHDFFQVQVNVFQQPHINLLTYDSNLLRQVLAMRAQLAVIFHEEFGISKPSIMLFLGSDTLLFLLLSQHRCCNNFNPFFWYFVPSITSTSFCIFERVPFHAPAFSA